ncbi:RNA polymerase sigma factor [Paractinoplanes maris]|uniref:RNA polymerase sigma factor n=1 Tax=Paractinoplanes maris TaxID=1734446 RepID=UPI00202212CA|nr:sigma-70 family RNA polymerase sigma factor [Actinoplanes maris]
MPDDEPLAGLIERAKNGDRVAWNAIVARFAPLVWSVCLRSGLSRTDAEDACQGVWMRLVEQLDKLREPAALPGWLVTTTRREGIRVQRLARQRELVERRAVREKELTAGQDLPDHGLLAVERQQALRTAFAELSEPCRRLLTLLLHDPPLPYAEIGARMGRPVGSLGPSRARCLDKLRRHPAILGLTGTEHEHTGRGNDDG